MTAALLLVKIIAEEREAEDIRSFLLASLDGSPLPSYDAGAHIDVHLGNGLVRQYSLCSGPQQAGKYRIAVKREQNSRGGSAWLHESAAVGKELKISSPRCAFPLDGSANFSLLIGGGIGITPLIAMAHELAARGEKFRLVQFAKSENHIPFIGELQASDWGNSFTTCCGLTREGAARAIDELLTSAPSSSHCYTCGPQPFMEVVAAAATRYLPKDHFHQESFSAPANVTGKAFTLRLLKSEKDVVVAENESALEALRRFGVDVPASCEVGVCGTCVTNVVEGQPLHGDTFLTEAERKSNVCFTPCVSRSVSETLVLDL